MKSNLHPLTHLAICIAVVLTLSTARAERGQFYVQADAGGVVTKNTELREFFGAQLAPNSEVKLDPGFRLGVRGGYGVTDWFDAEVETGIMANRIDSVTGATQTDAALANFPFLINARFHCPALHRVSPYFGGGVGGSTTVLTGDDLVISTTTGTTTTTTTLEGSTAGIVFAYQAFAGLRFAINEHMGVSIEYHYFATSSSDMRADVTSNTTSDHVRLGRTSSHAATLAFDYRF